MLSKLSGNTQTFFTATKLFFTIKQNLLFAAIVTYIELFTEKKPGKSDQLFVEWKPSEWSHLPLELAKPWHARQSTTHTRLPDLIDLFALVTVKCGIGKEHLHCSSWTVKLLFSQCDNFDHFISVVSFQFDRILMYSYDQTIYKTMF